MELIAFANVMVRRASVRTDMVSRYDVQERLFWLIDPSARLGMKIKRNGQEFCMDAAIFEELSRLLESGLASGELASTDQIQSQLAAFAERFGPDVLRGTDGEALLNLMHDRLDESGCLVYWLEYKNDDEFSTPSFGGIGGGSAFKFGIFQRQHDAAWVAGSSRGQHLVSLPEAVAMARSQRDELLAGADVLAAFNSRPPSDEVYARLQADMEEAAPTLYRTGWAHKYWTLVCPDQLDHFHSPRLQRFHLFKLLQMPPDQLGIKIDGNAARFNCAGRFVALAHELKVPMATLDQVLHRRSGVFHRYWKVGTTEGSIGPSRWPEMRDGGFVSIGWREQVRDLSETIALDRTSAKNQIREWILPLYDESGVATRKAGEILDFAQTMAESDLVLACEGETILGVGRVRGAYEYDTTTDGFPHRRPVEWLLLDRWQLPETEGPRTTVYELGKKAANLLEIERRMAARTAIVASAPRVAAANEAMPLPPLNDELARIDTILRRKGQVVLYGPPGTGKTYWALKAARELAARQAFKKTLASLADAERAIVDGGTGLVRTCTFHPGMGYEDFIEGLRPETLGGQLVFKPRDGIFKKLCVDAADHPERHFFLVVDEINRGDLPRIFGELITVIEYDKRDERVTLPVTQSSFSVPRNVFLIGTMNTADRSISLLDAALRRRFGFVELMPDSSRLTGREIGGLSLSAWLDALNARLRKSLKRDARNLQVGHAYLMSPKPPTSVAEFARILRDDIIPLIEEYCYDDFATLENILGKKLVDAEAGRIREELFSPGREGDLIQAVSFEQMQQFAMKQGADTGVPLEEADDPDEDENDSSAT